MRPPDGVLLAVANEFTRRAMYGMLVSTGFLEIKLCFTCADATAALNGSARRWRLLLLDGSLPHANETVRMLKRRIGPHLRIIVVFENPTEGEILGAMEAGTDDIVTCPLSQATLEDKIFRLLRISKRQLIEARMKKGRVAGRGIYQAYGL